MREKTLFFKTVSIFTLFLFFNSCTVQALKEVPKERASEVKNDNIVVIHQGEFIAVLDKAVLADGEISGYVKYYEKSKDTDLLLKELHLYFDIETDIKYDLKKKVFLPVDKIVKVEVYEHDSVKAGGNFILGMSAIAVGSVVVIGALAGIMWFLLSVGTSGE